MTADSTSHTAHALRHPKLRACAVLLLVLSLSVAIALALPTVVQADGCKLIADLAPKGAYGVADANGKIIASCRVDTPMIPASLVKIATALAALHILGPDYRFTTEFYLDQQDNLYIRGYGDPTLLTEEVRIIAQTLKGKGLTKVQGLYIDNSAFALEHQVPGQENSSRSYDAPVGPISVNFNSVALVRDKAGNTLSGDVYSPLLPIMKELGARRPPGQHRINICVGSNKNAEARMAQYAGELFAAMLGLEGIPVIKVGGIHPVPRNSRPLYIHLSNKTLADASHSMLRYSSNFIANLVYLNCGAKRYGYPATWQKARKAIREELLRHLGNASVKAIMQEEGSGLSRQNRISVRAMLHLLTVFRPNEHMLKKIQDCSVKSGTLTGVYNYAGYLPDGKAFVLILNQADNRRDTLLARIKKRYTAKSK